MQQLVPRDQFILLTDNRQDQRLLKINDNKKFNWRKTPIQLANIANHPYFTLFEVTPNSLAPIEWQFQEPDAEEEADNGQQANSNRQIFTIDEAQKLQTEQIEKMKKQLRPSEIISGLIENNQQFQKRTEYSKQKYLRKKERKYMFKIYAQPVTLDALHAYHFKQEARVIGSLRWDMLGLLLLYSSPYKKTILAEQSKGILLGSLLVKGAKDIAVVNTEKKGYKNFPIVQQLNIPKNKLELVNFTSWSDLIVSSNHNQYDNFIAFGNYNFVDLINSVQPLLKQGAIITFCCQSLSPLQEAGLLLKQRKYLNVRLQDSWCRQYQVLRNRTHPLMYMDSSSGYLLTAFKISS